jgi:acyl-CoA reductase-like NAD-dependent aldehyde dehydrogenase
MSAEAISRPLAASSRTATFERINPITGQVASRAHAATVGDAEAAADAAAVAQPAWAALGPNARRLALNTAADALEAKARHRGLGPLQHLARRRHGARGRRHDHPDRR